MFKRKRNNNLRAVYLMHSIDGFAGSLIGVFIPIYFLTLGYSVSQVIIYFIYYYILCCLFSFLSIYVAKYLGLVQSLIARFPFLLIYLVLLYSLKFSFWSLVFIGIFSALQNMLYWIPLHILFTNNVEKNVGSEIGKLFAFPQIIGMLGPLIGGTVAMIFGFKVLIAIVIFITSISVIPLLGQKPIKVSFSFKMAKGIRLFRKYKEIFWAEIFYNISDEVEAIIWPIFVFLVLDNTMSLGAISTILGFSSILFTLFMGNASDKHNKKKIMKIGSILLAIVWTLRYFFDNELMFYVITLLVGFFTILVSVPLHSVIYSAAKKDIVDEFFVFREIPVAISRVLILVIALIFVQNIQITFPIAGLSYLYFLFW